MNMFDLNQVVYYRELKIKGKIIDVLVAEDGNTNYLVEFENGDVKSLLGKDLQLANGKLLWAEPYVNAKKVELQRRVKELGCDVKLVIIRVDGDEASERYVRNKNKMCEEIGVLSETILLPNDVTQEEVRDVIEKLNSDDKVDGILLQLPLPKHLDEKYLLDQICPYKDVDSLSSWNLGKLLKDETYLPSCTSRGIVQLLKFYGVSLKGKDVLIINDSVIVGRPLSQLLLKEKATPTIAHKETKNLKDKIKQADIVVTATGQLRFLNADDFNENTVIVDVSININEEGKLEGDVDKKDYNELLVKGCSITPVPGSIGRTTVVSLLENVIEVVEKKVNKNE